MFQKQLEQLIEVLDNTERERDQAIRFSQVLLTLKINRFQMYSYQQMNVRLFTWKWSHKLMTWERREKLILVSRYLLTHSQLMDCKMCFLSANECFGFHKYWAINLQTSWHSMNMTFVYEIWSTWRNFVTLGTISN